MSLSSMSGSPNKKSLVNFRRADMDNFIKGISDYKVAYTPYFGHSTLNFGHKQFNAWKELSLNIINIGAPKHSAILEMVQRHYHKEKLSEELSKKSQVASTAISGPTTGAGKHRRASLTRVKSNWNHGSTLGAIESEQSSQDKTINRQKSNSNQIVSFNRQNSSKKNIQTNPILRTLS